MGTIFIVNNIKFIIHTRDHLPAHVTIYQGTPENFEAKVRIAIETLEIMDAHTEFKEKSVKEFIEIVRMRQAELMEEWHATRETK